MNKVSQKQYFTTIVSPANPIITKKVQNDIKIKNVLQISKTQINPLTISQKNNKQIKQQTSQQQQEQSHLTLLNAYNQKQLIYQKYDNIQYRKRGGKQYFASVFTNLVDMPQSKPYSKQINGLKFSSSAQSMNLFAVYQTETNEFDLILQNDLNTKGYTQWYYFSIRNRQKHQTIKLNIMNLYKSKSLYNLGMRPLAYSLKSNTGWQRIGTNIIYTDNQILMEYSTTYYRTLSFQYTFMQQNNQTYFAYCYPYTYTSLTQKMKLLWNNKRVKIYNIGITNLKNSIPMIQFSQQDLNVNKKSIIILARQHSGQTISSLIMDQILNYFSRQNNIENQFLFERFHIYCIPMVNIDGVILGNYRGNAFGYDLNRCWDRQNLSKVPQIYHIKRQIKKIHRKYPIQLILDLHGHSRKMNSFFFGNPFGKYCGLFAHIASKISAHISIEDSTFHKQNIQSQKCTTARIVLGNMIKDTGSVYTHQTSFFGFFYNNKNKHLNKQNIKQLSYSLVNAIYKTFIQIQKQQKILKQSIFLRQIRKKIDDFQDLKKTNEYNSYCSDSEDEKITQQQIKIKQNEQKNNQKYVININEQNLKQSQKYPLPKKSIQTQIGQSGIQFLDNNNIYNTSCNQQQQNQLDGSGVRKSQGKNKKLLHFNRKSQRCSLFVGIHKQPQDFTNDPTVNPGLFSPLSRKSYLMQKLRIYGQNCAEQNHKQLNKHTQAGNSISFTHLYGKQSQRQGYQSLKLTQYRRKKYRNKSLILKLQNKDKLTMADIVKVNKIQYKKIINNSFRYQNHQKSDKQIIKTHILPILI